MFIDGKLVASSKGKIRPLYDFLDSSPRNSLNGSLLKSSLNLKNSVLNSNNRIKFAKEERFFSNLEDKKNPYVSYQGPGNLDFKDSRANKYYKGASIGRGSKHDFSHDGKGRPGVGEYFLPSIWDRYWWILVLWLMIILVI